VDHQIGRAAGLEQQKEKEKKSHWQWSLTDAIDLENQGKYTRR